jgi:hypothetical protein
VPYHTRIHAEECNAEPSVMTPQGHPARSDPGQIVGPNEAVVLMRRTRAHFIKARTHQLSTTRPDI